MKKKRFFLAVLCSFGLGSAFARQSDNGDGTYTNPPLYADFPDPDIIRVGEDFYFATTTFANVPSLTILRSQDLVNWEYCSHVIPRLEGRDAYDLKGGNAYRNGVFAPSLRHHQGVFYCVVTPNGADQHTRIYSARDPRGPWTMRELDRSAFDPGLFFDDDGTGYIVTSGGWDGTATLLTLDSGYTRVISSEKIHYNRGAEGSKLVRRGEWYYLFNAIPRRLGLTVSRAKNLRGPWETRDQIDDRTGGHQGAIVDLPDGRDYGFVMVDAPYPGRMTNISPVFWKDGWPVWGTPEAPGRVPEKALKPIQGKAVAKPATSDSFDAPTLGLQWQWNHNPDDSRWSLSERKGWLRLRPTKSEDFWTARNTLTQKGWGPWSRGEITLDLSRLRAGDVCGFGTLGKFNGHIAITCGGDGKLSLGMNLIEDTTEGVKTEVRVALSPLGAKKIHLRTDLDLVAGKGACAYSLDDRTWHNLGGDFPIRFDWRTGTFQGPQYAIFCYNPQPGEGFADVADFRFSDDPGRPASLPSARHPRPGPGPRRQK